MKSYQQALTKATGGRGTFGILVPFQSQCQAMTPTRHRINQQSQCQAMTPTRHRINQQQYFSEAKTMREFIAPTVLFVAAHVTILFVAAQMYALGQ